MCRQLLGYRCEHARRCGRWQTWKPAPNAEQAGAFNVKRMGPQTRLAKDEIKSEAGDFDSPSLRCHQVFEVAVNFSLVPQIFAERLYWLRETRLRFPQARN